MIKPSKIINTSMRLLFVIFSIVVLVYFLSSPGETPYNYFTRLSESLLSGKLYITQNPPWLNELVSVNGKYYVVYPPMPAIIMMPYIFFFGEHASQTIFSIVLGSLNAVLVYLLLKRLKCSIRTSLLVTSFFVFGTNHWYLSSVGSAWFIAHISALFFLLLALLEAFGKQRFLLIGLLLGASFWARTPVVFVASFFYIYFWRKFWPINKKNLYNFLLLSSGIVFFISLDVMYNFLRFGNFSPFAPYHLIPNINNDPVFRDGFMSLKFIPRHVDAILFKLPKLTDHFPFLIPSLYSLAVWFTSPALLFVFRAPKTLLTIACWGAVLLILFVITQWAGVGYAQFGYRFIQDLMPFLLILIAFGIGQKPSKSAYLLVFLSILVNLWGVIMINFLNKWGW